MSKRNLVIAAACVLLVVLWWTCHRSGSAAGASQASGGRRGGQGLGGPVPVVAGEVEQKDVPIYLDGLGTVQAFNTVIVRTRVDGELTQVLFKEGQDVKADDLLAVVDPRPYQAALDQAVAKKAQDEAQLGNAQVILTRNTDLLRRKVIDQQDFDTSKFSVDQFKATVAADQAAIDNAKTQLDYTQIRSPIDGRTGIRMVDVGNVVHAADTNGIVVITQLQPISVVFTLPEQNLQELLNQGGESGGLPVAALDRGNTAPLGNGTLAVVDNEIDQTTGTVKLKATFANNDLKLWPGKFVNARLVLRTQKNALVVPAAVVQRGPQGSYAYVIKPDKTVAMQTVKVGPTEDGESVIESGLTSGEQVVVDGQYKLQPGSHVELTSPNEQKTATAAPARQAGGKGRRPKKS
ncbi:MAG TPA: efflux RND transporter periplasmic adaptor subunit [Chthoniobacterales bacterium]|nr:efflux RND transporter periplasmic adaptor subunit [Chthoniobacterales bacterium]